MFCVDESESELGILDLIQVLVETLDRCFENVCELDLVFHMDKVLPIARRSPAQLTAGSRFRCIQSRTKSSKLGWF